MKRTVTGQHAIFLALVTLICAPACVTDPQPFPMPLQPPDPQSIYVSNPELTQSGVATGLPGAVMTPEDDELEVVISKTNRSDETRGLVFQDGSFSVKIALLGGDILEARLERASEQSNRVALLWSESTPSDALLDLNASAAQGGQVTVTGKATAGHRVMVSNLRSGAATSTVATGSSDFTAVIPGATGDRISAFAVNPQTRVGTRALEALVPP
jgi:hypothetical protein